MNGEKPILKQLREEILQPARRARKLVAIEQTFFTPEKFEKEISEGNFRFPPKYFKLVSHEEVIKFYEKHRNWMEENTRKVVKEYNRKIEEVKKDYQKQNQMELF